MDPIYALQSPHDPMTVRDLQKARRSRPDFLAVKRKFGVSEDWLIAAVKAQKKEDQLMPRRCPHCQRVLQVPIELPTMNHVVSDLPLKGA